jgi:putative addiction module killer protein
MGLVLEIVRFQAADGAEPVSEWLRAIKDKQAQARIRIQRLATGNFGDCEPVGDGVSELREHFGPGYRIYLARRGKTLVVLLCGGTKKTQAADIELAKRYWADWKRRQP